MSSLDKFPGTHKSASLVLCEMFGCAKWPQRSRTRDEVFSQPPVGTCGLTEEDSAKKYGAAAASRRAVGACLGHASGMLLASLGLEGHTKGPCQETCRRCTRSWKGHAGCRHAGTGRGGAFCSPPARQRRRLRHKVLPSVWGCAARPLLTLRSRSVRLRQQG